jgi:hypothetical protein
MLSGRLVHLIESHWDQVMTRIIDEIRREPHLGQARAHIEAELRDRGQDLLQNLGHWLAAGHEDDLAVQFETLGKLQFHEGVALHDALRGLFIVREKMLDFVEEHIFTKNALELYAEEELERRLGRFFDLLTIHLVRGYERALRTTVAHSV